MNDEFHVNAGQRLELNKAGIQLTEVQRDNEDGVGGKLNSEQLTREANESAEKAYAILYVLADELRTRLSVVLVKFGMVDQYNALGKPEQAQRALEQARQRFQEKIPAYLSQSQRALDLLNFSAAEMAQKYGDKAQQVLDGRAKLEASIDLVEDLKQKLQIE